RWRETKRSELEWKDRRVSALSGAAAEGPPAEAGVWVCRLTSAGEVGTNSSPARREPPESWWPRELPATIPTRIAPSCREEKHTNAGDLGSPAVHPPPTPEGLAPARQREVSGGSPWWQTGRRGVAPRATKGTGKQSGEESTRRGVSDLDG
ncbi:MAG: hypothetical protein AAGJ80_19745, partial [Cyanobacteria bacterium J06553_1]